MSRIEQGLELAGPALTPQNEQIKEVERVQLLELIGQLADPHLASDLRLNLVERMRCLLSGETPQPWLPETELYEMVYPVASLGVLAGVVIE